MALAILGGLFAALAAFGGIRAAWRNCEGRRGVFAALAILAAICSIVAQKPSPDTPTITVDALLRDVGCYATNNVFHAAVTNAPSYAGVDFSDCDLMVYARERASTNVASWFELTPRKKFSQQPADYAIENATNFNYMVYLNYVPPSPVHTNGVFELYGFVIENEAQGEPDQLAAGFINSRAFLAPPTARDYIQDGLVAMWDGIENAGWGIHNPNATVWKDLTGSGYDFAVPSSKASFGDMCLNLSNTSVSANLPEVSRTEFTIECVAKSTGVQGAWVWMRNPSWVGGALVGLQSTGLCYYPWYNIGRVGDQDFANVSVTWNAATKVMYKNATSIATASRSIDSRNVLATIYIGEYNGNKKNTMGCYSVRLYSRALSADEIQHNYKIDKERFNMP